MRIYVGNLAWSATEEEVRNAFEEFGQVTSVNIIMDRETGRSRGFAFVEMADDREGREAIDRINSADIAGRAVTVNEAKPRTNRGDGGFGGGGGGRGRGGDRGGQREREW